MSRRLLDHDDLGQYTVGTPQPMGAMASPTYGYSVPNDTTVEVLGGGRESTYRNSTMQPRTSDPGIGPRISATSGDVFVRGSLLDRNIEATSAPAAGKPERARDYKGRIRIWPGLMFMVLIVGAAGFLVTYYGLQAHDASNSRAKAYEAAKFNATTIKGGANTSLGADLVEDDGIVGNPKKYPKSTCELPDYQSKKGKIWAVSKNGTEVPIKIKGINWFGMETGQNVPFGLWENSDNGTSAYQIASFLAKNKFNAVRLPLMADAILGNGKINIYIVNQNENRALNLTNYMSLIQSITKVLQYRQIGVMISMHTLTYKDNGNLWYNNDITEDMFLKSIDILTANLCTKEYWNIMGIDVKNEPYGGVWGGGGAKDFRAGAIRIANRMLKGCPKWMGFVEGVNAQHTITIDGEEFGYYDWFGGGLHGARNDPLDFSVPNKVVYAPHYYTPAVFPQYYLFGGGEVGAGNAINGYVELSDDKLRNRIKVTMDDMFGFLAGETGPALLLGEFGGLYNEDAHPMKTTKRCTDFTIEVIKQPGWAGGFVWSLNPESAYQYNPADTPGNYVEGMVTSDWLTGNTNFLKGMAAMDDMDDLVKFPCFVEYESESASGSGTA